MHKFGANNLWIVAFVLLRKKGAHFSGERLGEKVVCKPYLRRRELLREPPLFLLLPDEEDLDLMPSR